MDPMRKHIPKNIAGPDGKSRFCVYTKLFGIPVWMEPYKRRYFMRAAKLLGKLEKKQKNVLSQMDEIKHLAEEIKRIEGGNKKGV